MRRNSNSLLSLSIGVLGVRIAGARVSVGRKGDGLVAVAFGFQPRLARHQFVEALGDDRQIGAHDRFVEPHQNVDRL